MRAGEVASRSGTDLGRGSRSSARSRPGSRMQRRGKGGRDKDGAWALPAVTKCRDQVHARMLGGRPVTGTRREDAPGRQSTRTENRGRLALELAHA
jgi:hypothetical protein